MFVTCVKRADVMANGGLRITPGLIKQAVQHLRSPQTGWGGNRSWKQDGLKIEAVKAEACQ